MVIKPWHFLAFSPLAGFALVLIGFIWEGLLLGPWALGVIELDPLVKVISSVGTLLLGIAAVWASRNGSAKQAFAIESLKKSHAHEKAMSDKAHREIKAENRWQQDKLEKTQAAHEEALIQIHALEEKLRIAVELNEHRDKLLISAGNMVEIQELEIAQNRAEIVKLKAQITGSAQSTPQAEPPAA